MSTAGFLILILSLFIFSTLSYGGGFQTTFVLERRTDSMDMKHSEVIARDRARHLQRSSSMNGVINFPIEGPKITGCYFTKVKIGNPPKEYHLTIDTGSDLTWVNCIPSNSTIHLSSYDLRSSNSAEPLSCSDSMCSSLPYSTNSNCPSNSHCNYSVSYGDGTQASGYYLSDAFHFGTFVGNSSARASTTAKVVFGCTTHQYGDFTEPDSAIDGLLGLGRDGMSFISQLESQGVIPNVFSHCLNGEGKGGGGTLILGEILEPGMMYTPLVPNEAHYNVNLLSISINGKTLSIDPNVFSISRDRLGTIFDSGSTYSYLPEEAYDPFLSALFAALPPSAIPHIFDGIQCFLVSSRDVFPLISLNFKGGASMVLKPEAYLLYADGLWCIGFQKNKIQNNQRLTILGDIFLKDKVIVYDLAQQRLGWADYDCSSSVNVSLVPPRVSCSSQLVLYHQLLPIVAGSFFVYISMFAGLLYL